jgi:hypothetical protein
MLPFLHEDQTEDRVDDHVLEMIRVGNFATDVRFRVRAFSLLENFVYLSGYSGSPPDTVTLSVLLYELVENLLEDREELFFILSRLKVLYHQDDCRSLIHSHATPFTDLNSAPGESLMFFPSTFNPNMIWAIEMAEDLAVPST